MVCWAPLMADLDKELGDIRREVIESRTLVIRADNQLKTLHAEVKTLARKLDGAVARQRWPLPWPRPLRPAGRGSRAGGGGGAEFGGNP